MRWCPDRPGQPRSPARSRWCRTPRTQRCPARAWPVRPGPAGRPLRWPRRCAAPPAPGRRSPPRAPGPRGTRSEEHTSELQSRGHLVCRLLLEKKKGQSTHYRRALRRNLDLFEYFLDTAEYVAEGTVGVALERDVAESEGMTSALLSRGRREAL